MGRPVVLVDIMKISALRSGLGEFSLNFANELSCIDDLPFHVKFLLPPNTDANLSVPKTNQLNPSWPQRYVRGYSREFVLWHSLCQFASFQPSSQVKRILTIHDLNFLIEKKANKRQKYLRRLQKEVDSSTAITTISTYSKNQILEHIEVGTKPVNVIYNGIRLTEYPLALKPSYVDDRKLLFSIGLFSAKKNFHSLIDLLRKLPSYQLVIAGNHDTAYGKDFCKMVADFGLENQIILPGKISDEDKYWCYKNATAFLFPSKAEGFGMPVIEAMKAGTPVFALNQTALTEIGDNHVFFWDTEADINDVDFFNSSLVNYQTNLEKRAAAITYAKSFDWHTCVQDYINLYKTILDD